MNEKDAPLLDLRGIGVRFGGVHAVQDVDLQLKAGRLYGLVGPNGSGKTTMLGAITRLVPLYSGRLLFDGVDYTSVPPDKVAGLGIARTFQGIRLLASLDVASNVRLGADLDASRRRGLDWFVGRRRAGATEQVVEQRAMEALDRVGLAHVAWLDPATLSYGLQRRVEIARAITMHPRLLLLDEPTAGMRESERDEIMELALRLRDEGITILLVEHNLRMVNAICDHVFVMDFGRCVAAGAPAEVMRDPAVRKAYLGEDHDVATS